MQRSSEIEAVQNWYAQEGKQPGYWVPNPLDPDEPQPTKERKALGHDVGRLIGYLERNDMTMAYREADDLKVNLKQLVADATGPGPGPGMVAHIARTRVHR